MFQRPLEQGITVAVYFKLWTNSCLTLKAHNLSNVVWCKKDEISGRDHWKQIKVMIMFDLTNERPALKLNWPMRDEISLYQSTKISADICLGVSVNELDKENLWPRSLITYQHDLLSANQKSGCLGSDQSEDTINLPFVCVNCINVCWWPFRSEEKQK